MNIWIAGVSGFIGRHLYCALSQHGFHVTGSSRHEVPGINWQPLDFNQSAEEWKQQLQNIDAVINAVGIFRQSDTQRFSQIHDLGPRRLFEACRKQNIRVIQISAIGADEEVPVTEFLQSKRNADQYLLQGELPNVVLYPGIVLGEEGKTTRQLCLLARLLCMPLVFGRNKELPLISIDQLSKHIVEIINNLPEKKQAKVLIAKPETMEHLLNSLRLWMGLGKGCFFYLPEKILQIGFRFLPTISVGAFNKQSIEMLAAYSNQSYVPVTKETASDSLLKINATKSFNRDMRRRMLFYINLIALGIIWIVSGLSSLINFEQSRELIALIGIQGSSGDAMITTAAIGDILLGVLLWYPPLRRWVIYIQIGVMLMYSLIIFIFIPMLWLHPFAPVIKNLAMFVLALYLLAEEKE